MDEYTRECLSLDVARRLRSDDVLARLAQLFVERGPPVYLRSDNGPEFTATAVRSWLRRLGVTTLFIAPGSPWENGDVESFNGKLRDEGLNPEIFTTLLEAQILIERWRREYNQVRPHSAVGVQNLIRPVKQADRGCLARSVVPGRVPRGRPTSSRRSIEHPRTAVRLSHGHAIREPHVFPPGPCFPRRGEDATNPRGEPFPSNHGADGVLHPHGFAIAERSAQ